MDKHVRILGYLTIICGAFGLLGALFVLLVFGGIAGILGTNAGDGNVPLVAIPIVGIIAAVMVLLILALSVPLIIGGIGLLRLRPWARVLIIVVSAFNLLNVPVGTVLGLYGLWVLLSLETEMLFSHPPYIKKH